ncbi:phage tail protein [Paracandidimonas soli]|uniref:Tail completion protein R (GpR) n=1 Tax=Paracandidimonas soli TaxID=1917182 RepID=A0A4R3V969_9BURK|nr:phage tail protein [Paracandidimonas soli]TCV00511.1 tail completion protein R (GpR) [Paracandidimonas soli]
MLKPTAVRDIITRANPYLKRDPDKLQVFLDSGRIVARGAASLSYEYRYTLTIIVQDFPNHADQIILPMLAYLRTQQPELFENVELSNNLIRFDAEVINQDLIDLSMQVDLTERVIVAQQDGKLTATHVGEPALPDFPEQDISIELVNKKTGEVLGVFTAPAWNPQF